MRRRLDTWIVVIVVLAAVVACSGPVGPGGPSGRDVVVTDEPVVVTLPSGGTVTIPPLPAGESAVVTIEESALPFTGEFVPLEWLTAAVSLSTDDDVEWAEDAVVQLSLPLTSSPGLSTQAFTATNSVGIIRVAGAPDDLFGIPSSVLFAKPRLNSSTGFVDLDVPAGFLLNSSGVNARDVQVRIAGNVIEWRKTLWPAQEGVFRVVPTKVPSQRDGFGDACGSGLNDLADLLTEDLRGTRSTAVIMVHGWQTLNQFLVGGDNINHLVHCIGWIDVMAAFFYQAGDWQDLREHADLFTFRYNSDKRIVESGEKLKNVVERLRALGYGTVVLLGHSMGGLVSVEARQQLEYPAYLAGIVTLGTPFMGGVIECVERRTLVVGSREPESYCTEMRDPPTFGVVSGVLDFINAAGGSYDLTQFAPVLPQPGALMNPYLGRLWAEAGGRNFENIVAIYGDSSLPSMIETPLKKVAERYSKSFGPNDGAVPVFSAVASFRGLDGGANPLPNSELTFRRPVAVGRDHGQLLGGCTNCADGRQGNPNAYDPYFDTVADALLEFVPIVDVSIAPTTATLEPGATQSFTATVTGSANTSVTWSTPCGSVSGSGNTVTYTAPGEAGSCSVMATSVADASKSASASVTVTSAPVVSVSVAPSSVSLPVNGTQSFTATVTNAGDTSVAWSATCGGITGSGTTVTYTAPGAAGSCSVTATSVADASKSASATVTVTGGEPTAGADLIVRGLSVTPNAAIGGADVTVAFSVENVGDASAGSSTVRVRINDDPTNVTTSDALLAQLATSALAAGQAQAYSRTVSLPSGLADGTHYVWVVADVFNEADQSNYDNDRGVASIVIGGASGAACTDPAQVISIPDPNLHAAIRATLGIPVAPVLCQDMWNVTELIANGAGIASLEGIQHATGLQKLDFANHLVGPANSIIDVSPLANLSHLQQLFLDRNNVRDVSPLESLTALLDLGLGSNAILDFAPLASLTNLRYLDLAQADLSDVSFLADLTNLQTLSISGATISDVSPMSSLTNLVWLQLDENRISDVSPLAHLGSIEWLFLGDNTISDVSPIANLTSLRTLWLHRNSISDVSPLANLTDLERLLLSGNSIADLSQLAGLASLRGLGLGGNEIGDISPLGGLIGLQELDLSRNDIVDIAPLASLVGLTFLSLDTNRISDVAPLMNLVNLEQLNLASNEVSDIAPLAGLTDLRKLLLGSNDISDISSLQHLTSLAVLGLEVNRVADVSPLVLNAGIGAGDQVGLQNNCLVLSAGSDDMLLIQALRDRDVLVSYEPQRSCDP